MKITARVYVNRNVFLGCMVLYCTLYRVCTLYTVQGIVTHQVYHLNADLVLLVHCTLYTVHCTGYVHCTLYRVCTLYTVQRMYTVHCTGYVHCTLYRVCTLYTVQGMVTHQVYHLNADLILLVHRM